MRPVTRSELPIGAVLSEKYRITREIGRGGMAAVYEAQHVDIGKRVAVKVLDAALAKSSSVVERFHREARAAASVDSPYICDVYDAGRLPDSRPYLVLELLEGESLYDRMCRLEWLGPPDVARILGQVARGLQKAHSAGIVHRDLKPENIFLSLDGEGQEVAKIVDFGLAKFFGPTAAPQDSPRLTREGAIFGTPMYMSPEQISGQGFADHRSDLWALGCIAFECLTGRPVWKVDQGIALIFAQIAAAPVPVPSRVSPTLPAAFDAWLTRALARAPDERFQSAAEFGESLAVSLGQETVLGLSSPVLVRAPSLPEQRRPALTAPESPDSRPEAFAPTEPPPPHGAAGEIGTAPLIPAPPRAPSGAQPPAVTSPRAPSAMIVTVPSASQFAQPLQPPARPPRKSRWWLAPAVGLLALGGATTGFFLFGRTPSSHPASGSVVSSPQGIPGVGSAPVPSSSAPSSASSPEPQPEPEASTVEPPLPFAAAITRAQRLFSQGKQQEAVRELEDATANSDNGALLTLLGHARLAAADPGRCRVRGLGRPRPFSWTSSLRDPSLAVGSQGPVLAWIDDQGQKQKWAVRALRLGSDLQASGLPLNVAPSAGMVLSASALRSGDGFLLVFGDDAIGTRGAFLRTLDPLARPVGPLQRLATSRASAAHPSAAVVPDGSIAVAFSDAPSEGPSDIMYQRYKSDLTPLAPAAKWAEYAVPSSRQSGASPSVAGSHDRIVVAWRRENLREHAILVRAVKPDGSRAWPDADTEGIVLSEPRVKVRAPELACNGTTCLVAWRSEPSGSNLAAIDAATGAIRWRKALSSRGTQVGVALGVDGSGLVAWHEAGRLKASTILAEGLGESMVLGASHGEHAAPSIVESGRPGEWLVSWACFEAGHAEGFVVRLSCSP